MDVFAGIAYLDRRSAADFRPTLLDRDTLAVKHVHQGGVRPAGKEPGGFWVFARWAADDARIDKNSPGAGNDALDTSGGKGLAIPRDSAALINAFSTLI